MKKALSLVFLVTVAILVVLVVGLYLIPSASHPTLKVVDVVKDAKYTNLTAVRNLQSVGENLYFNAIKKGHGRSVFTLNPDGRITPVAPGVKIDTSVSNLHVDEFNRIYFDDSTDSVLYRYGIEEGLEEIFHVDSLPSNNSDKIWGVYTVGTTIFISTSGLARGVRVLWMLAPDGTVSPVEYPDELPEGLTAEQEEIFKNATPLFLGDLTRGVSFSDSLYLLARNVRRQSGLFKVDKEGVASLVTEFDVESITFADNPIQVIGDELLVKGRDDTGKSSLYRYDLSGSELSRSTPFGQTGNLQVFYMSEFNDEIVVGVHNIDTREWGLYAYDPLRPAEANIRVPSRVYSFAESDAIKAMTMDTGARSYALVEFNSDGGLETLFDTTDITTSGFGTIGHTTAVGDKVFFTLETPTAGKELWVYEAEQEPRIVKDINTRVEAVKNFAFKDLFSDSDALSSRPSKLVEHQGHLYFTAKTAGKASRLWRVD